MRVDGGFVVLNFVKYRERDATTADRSRKWRERQKQQRSVNVAQRRDTTATDTERHQAEAEAEADNYKIKGGENPPPEPITALRNDEIIPPDLHAMEYSRKLLEQIQFPTNQTNLRAVSSAIECEVKAGKSKPAAYEFVLAGTLDGIDEGFEINAFFFGDAKYRVENRRSTNGGSSKSQQRTERNRGAIIDALRDHTSERDGDNPSQRKG